MKFLCIPCDEKMETQVDGIMPEEKKNLAMKFKCKKCGHSIAMLTNKFETEFVSKLGVQMGEIPKIKINFNVFAASTVRLIGGPVLALLIVPYFGLEGLERSTGILQAAMPAAVLASIIALEYKLLPEFVTTTVLFSTLYSILTLTVILTVI